MFIVMRYNNDDFETNNEMLAYANTEKEANVYLKSLNKWDNTYPRPTSQDLDAKGNHNSKEYKDYIKALTIYSSKRYEYLKEVSLLLIQEFNLNDNEYLGSFQDYIYYICELTTWDVK